MKTLVTAVAFAALAFSPAFAAKSKMMACSGENMGKSMTAMGTVDTPAKMAMAKEMSAANSDMSKGKMRSACMHYTKAQRMGAK